jgi:RNA polymerase sigma-70 factor (ECF subfamily)
MSQRLPPETSLSLLADICRPSPDAATWARFVRLYGPAIAGWCRRRGLNASDAEEVTQAVFCLLVRRLPEFNYDPTKGAFRSWLRTITTREAISYLRAEARHRVASLVGDEPAGDDLMQGVAERDLLHAALENARALCEAREWEAFSAVKLRGQSASDTAHQLGVPASEVYRICYRVKLILADAVARLEDTEGNRP